MTPAQHKSDRPIAALLVPDILALLEEAPGDLAAETEEMHAADLANVVEELPRERVGDFLRALSPNRAAQVIEYLDDELHAEFLEHVSTEQAAEIISEMTPDDRADVLEALEEEKADEILADLPKEEREETEKLLQYEPDTAGGLMTTELVSVQQSLTVEEALAQVRAAARSGRRESIHAIYVIDADGKLVGVMSVRELLAAPEGASVADVIHTEIVSVQTSADREEVARVTSEYDLVVVPVVDGFGRIVGVITVDDVLVQEYLEGGDGQIYFCLYLAAPGLSPPVTFVGRKILQWPPLRGSTAACRACGGAGSCPAPGGSEAGRAEEARILGKAVRRPEAISNKLSKTRQFTIPVPGSASAEAYTFMFSTIIGHRRLVSLLSRAIARSTMPPALLLAGPAGVGKRRVAMAVAQAINCLEPRSTSELERDACGKCASCRRIERGTHPDVIVIEPGDTGSIKIEAVREVVDRASYRPFEGRHRVVIIDEADALVAPAQNALLKTLEEMPAASIFLLVSSMPDALLPTVRSRCPRLRFGPLSPGEVARALVRDHKYSEPDARAAAADADGSIGRALTDDAADLTAARDDARRLLEQSARTDDPAFADRPRRPALHVDDHRRVLLSSHELSTVGGPGERIRTGIEHEDGAFHLLRVAGSQVANEQGELTVLCRVVVRQLAAIC